MGSFSHTCIGGDDRSLVISNFKNHLECYEAENKNQFEAGLTNIDSYKKKTCNIISTNL